MRRSASLHPDPAWRDALEELTKFRSREFSSHRGATFLLDRMNLKKVLRQIDANSDKGFHGRSPRWWRFGDHVLALDAVWVGPSTPSWPGWVGHMAALLEPLAERIARHVRAGAALHADDTPVPVLDPGRGRTKTGRLWTAVRDESPYGSTAPPAAFYLYSPDRKAERAHALLKGCRGHLHADAYAGFAGLYEADPLTGAPAPLTEVACWAHARRKIYDIHVETKSPAAAQALEMIARLFAIEADIKGRSAVLVSSRWPQDGDRRFRRRAIDVGRRRDVARRGGASDGDRARGWRAGFPIAVIRCAVTHTLADMVRARILAIACGYEDADDLDALRVDPAFKLACGRLPETAPTCVRSRRCRGWRTRLR